MYITTTDFTAIFYHAVAAQKLGIDMELFAYRSKKGGFRMWVLGDHYIRYKGFSKHEIVATAIMESHWEKIPK